MNSWLETRGRSNDNISISAIIQSSTHLLTSSSGSSRLHLPEMNATAPAITCRSSSSWELLEWTVELAAKAADRVWTWQECREESGVAALLTLFSGLVVLAVVLT